ncbi:MAG: aspartyl/asparaginyl beta-hydroxylase domain-containing protein [Chitinophagaceae bacterium]
MIKYLQLPFHFDVKKMQDELRLIDKRNWQLHYQKMHYEGNWSAIPLRSIRGEAENIFVSPETNPDYKDTIFLNNCAYFKEILSFFKCPLSGVRLMKLNAGAIIKEHKDAKLCFEHGHIRIHIPVITHIDVEFWLDQEKMNLKEGECWYLNFNLLHAVLNKSNADRVHLVIDAEVNDWVQEIFLNQALIKKEMEEPGYDDATKKGVIVQLRKMNSETSNKLADEMEDSI